MLNQDVSTARASLMRSVCGPVAGTLTSFGPSMGLAKLLKSAGESDIVLSYLRQCAKIWPSKEDYFDALIFALKGGYVPYWGPHEYY